MRWSATQYAKFLDDRTRPARDLLAALPLEAPDLVVDIGCGPGNSTALLAERFPGAQVVGLDPDADMIRTAQAAQAGCRFVQGNVESWRPETPPDLIFANASLQWVPDHRVLLPHLVGLLRPGGALAVQMPDNLDEPSHVAMRRSAADPRWSARLAAAAGQRQPLLSPVALHALLRPLCARVDVWRTTYHVELDGLEGIVGWFLGSALRPYLDRLDKAERPAFLAAYRREIAPHYPEIAGRVLLPFPRSFLVATAL
ncbi:trans-aconitate 2-methyltransferase [Paracoccus sp. P2]|uniref:Trans-aconitate 2-methyltransferase n=1 Tax=Paracoccus pantotrophus TaxID=82367 RepID=A0A7H9BVV2_PARPN|nr:trans-aconitate 2-methyltransferase [Paracoccus pantotrophus]QLH13971.1 trans-aconitate 2-methyltransferase [Paracoccus pantotrophus]RDD96957.1 trans-aconitate 2-methyltransferase [Paracoccus pantotrophus]RNI17411.1 trans-aconitate 2-methyltransferase [Paracoccus pantotrophus]WGR66896.1 trans-aconitate 2-methyltransferase [Paracoccus pantotrophus]